MKKGLFVLLVGIVSAWAIPLCSMSDVLSPGGVMNTSSLLMGAQGVTIFGAVILVVGLINRGINNLLGF